eukprot:Skav207208  [mRNA]  locus=scaffold1244:20432:22300:+ [translate_table: standard]
MGFVPHHTLAQGPRRHDIRKPNRFSEVSFRAAQQKFKSSKYVVSFPLAAFNWHEMIDIPSRHPSEGTRSSGANVMGWMCHWAISISWILRLASALTIGRVHAQQPQVTLPTGATVIGRTISTPDGDVLAYSNLRYAITLNRFGAPIVSTTMPSEVIDGTVPNEPCIQRGGRRGVKGIEA